MVQINLLMFASLRDKFSEEDLVKITIDKTDWPNSSQLKDHLLSVLAGRWFLKYGQDQVEEFKLPDQASLMLAINESYVDSSKSIQLSDGDNIALIPPVSGG